MKELIAVNFLSAFWAIGRLKYLNSAQKIFGRVTFLACSLLLSSLFHCYPILSIFTPIAIVLLLVGFRQISDTRERLHRQKQLKILLDEIIFAMKSGRSLKIGMGKACSSLPDGWLKDRMKLRQTELELKCQRGKDRHFLPVDRELARIESAPHHALALLESWRLRLGRELEFRMKSKQVTAQLRAQTFLLTLFYIAAVLFLSVQGGVARYPRLILISFSLFVLGLVLVFWLGRRVKWDF